jgi:hypothetical protein
MATDLKSIAFTVSALLAMACLSTAGAAVAGEWEVSGSVAGELRVFPVEPAYADQDDATFSPSLSFEPEIVYEWNDGDDRLTVEPFARLDAYDENRTHWDLREANWLHIGDGWDLVVGIDKVFWGVTESRHLVDIVNQTDLVEDVDGEDKLGQPMINLNLDRNWGALGLFVLPGFRERIFPDDEARLRGPVPIDGDNATYESGAGAGHVDFAVRWSHVIADWDIGLSYFRGTSREPLFVASIGAGGQPVLVPHYDQIDQAGLDVQLTTGAWLWKLEAMTRGGHGDRFLAAVGGFEYTFFQVGGGNADLGMLAEYLYDGRDTAAPATMADDDIFIGTRLALHDPQDSTLLAGAVVDRSSGATALSVEAERRLGDSWKLELEGRLFFGVPVDDVLFGIRDDDYLTLRLTRFF